MHSLFTLFSHREVLKNLVLRNLRIRYKGSVLGFLWAFLNPLFTMIIFYIVFSRIIRIQVEQYPLFLLSALLPWTFFASSLNDATHSIIDNANLVKKVHFPRAILPISYVLSNFVNFLFSLAILLPVLIIFRAGGLKFVYLLPIILIAHLFFTVGLALFLSCANVYFRDVSHILGIVLMFWFYLTPIFYPLEMVPIQFHNFYLLNPMSLIITVYRNILFEGRMPGIANLFVVLLIVIVVLLFGYHNFKKYESSFAKEI